MCIPKPGGMRGHFSWPVPLGPLLLHGAVLQPLPTPHPIHPPRKAGQAQGPKLCPLPGISVCLSFLL